MRYTEMKDSGVESIGEIPKHWECIKARRVFQNDKNGIRVGPFGSALTNAVVSADEGTVKVYGQANLIRKDFVYGNNFVSEETYHRLKEYEVLPNDIAVSMMGTIGKCCVIPEGIATGIMDSHLIKIRLNKTMRPKFFEYFYESSAVFEQLLVSSKGSIMSGLNSGIVKRISLALPPLSEQDAITAFLDEKCTTIDEIIGQAKATIEEYKAWKASVIFETVTKGLDPDAEMKDSGVEWIGKIPKHWKAVALKRLYDFSTGAAVRVGPFGSALSTADYTNSGELVYNQRVVLDKDFEQNAVFVSEQKARDLTSFSVFPGDILITTRGSIGTIMIVPPNAPKGILHPCIIRFRINSDKYSYRLLEYIFNDTDLIKNQILYHSNSTTIDVLYSYTLKELRIPLIPMNEQKTILDYLDKKCAAIDTIIEEKQTLIDELETYKKSLIFETVTGKRRVC